MSTKYQMWLNYDNDKTKYLFPVLPESLKYSYKGLSTSSEIDKFGEVFHKGKRGAGGIAFSSFFPPAFDSSYCSGVSKQWHSPKSWVSYIRKLMSSSKPGHFVLTGGPLAIDIYVIITSFTASEEGGDVGTVHYTLEMKEYRTVTVNKLIKKTTTSQTKVQTSKTRPSNSAKKRTYTIKNGDCLWNIAKKYYGDGAKHTKIYNANKSTLNKAAKKYGYSDCRNGNLIFPGTTIMIP